MRWICFVILLATIAAHAAAHIDSKPSPDGPIYDLPGLHGTAAQIGKQIHADTDQLKSNIADAQAALKNIDTEIANDRVYLATQLLKTDSTYAYVCKTLDDTKTELATATNKVQIDRLQNKLAGFTKRKGEIEDQDFPDDKQYADFQKHRADQQSKLDALQKALDKANAWRSKLAEATRTSETFTWPIGDGDTGIAGWVIIKDTSHGIITADTHVFVPESTEGQQEGITVIRGHRIPATFIIHGLPTDHLSVGQTALLDQTLVITDIVRDEDELTIHARKSAAPIDDLLAVFREWQTPVTDP